VNVGTFALFLSEALAGVATTNCDVFLASVASSAWYMAIRYEFKYNHADGHQFEWRISFQNFCEDLAVHDGPEDFAGRNFSAFK
jgi:hypothetical protein